MRTVRGRKATNAFSRSRPLSTFNRISKWRTHKFRNATRQEEPGPRKRALVHRQSHGQGLSRGVAVIGQFSNRRQINMKELRNIRTSHSLYFLIHDQRGRSHGVAISKKVRCEKVLFSTRFSARDVLSSSTNFLPTRSDPGFLYPGSFARRWAALLDRSRGRRRRRLAIRMVCEFVRRPRREGRLDGVPASRCHGDAGITAPLGFNTRPHGKFSTRILSKD